MITDQLNVGVPTSPLVNPVTGRLNTEWRAFFVALQMRTGGTIGQSLDTLETEINAEQQARIQADQALGASLDNEAALRKDADTQLNTAIGNETTTRALQDGLKLSLTGGTMIGPVNVLDPVANMQPVTLQYFDSHLPAGGIAEAPTDGSSYGRCNAAWTQVLPLTGGTLSGSLTVQDDTDCKLYLTNLTGGDWPGVVWNAGPGLAAFVQAERNGSVRWTVQFMTGDAESGGNAGSDFLVSRFNDSGGYISDPLRISRASGLGIVSGDPVAPLGIATKQYVDAHASSGGPFLPLSGGIVTGPLFVEAPFIVQLDSYPNVEFRNAAGQSIGSVGADTATGSPTAFLHLHSAASSDMWMEDTKVVVSFQGGAQYDVLTSAGVRMPNPLTILWNDTAPSYSTFGFWDTNTNTGFGFFPYNPTTLAISVTDGGGHATSPGFLFDTSIGVLKIPTTGGLHLSQVNSDPSSVVGGIEMYPGYGGFGVSAGTLNYNWGGTHRFLNGATPLMSLSTGGVIVDVDFYLAGSAVSDWRFTRSTDGWRHHQWRSDGWEDAWYEGTGQRLWQSPTQVLMTLDGSANLTVNGNGYKPGGGSWAATSDEWVKRDVADYTAGLDAICALKPVRYRYNGRGGTTDDDREHIGLIAQQAQGPMPELITEVPGAVRDDGQPVLGLDPGPVTWALVNCVRTLRDQVAALTARIATLEGART